jgi:hypothetical protein
MRQVVIQASITLGAAGLAAFAAYEFGVKAGHSAGVQHGQRLLLHEAAERGLGRWSSMGDGEPAIFEWTAYPSIWQVQADSG